MYIRSSARRRTPSPTARENIEREIAQAKLVQSKAAQKGGASADARVISGIESQDTLETMIQIEAIAIAKGGASSDAPQRSILKQPTIEGHFEKGADERREKPPKTKVSFTDDRIWECEHPHWNEEWLDGWSNSQLRKIVASGAYRLRLLDYEK